MDLKSKQIQSRHCLNQLPNQGRFHPGLYICARAQHGAKLTSPTATRFGDAATRLTYSTGKTHLDITLEYGVMGRVFFNFTEYALATDDASDVGGGLSLPRDMAIGGLSFKLGDTPEATAPKTGGTLVSIPQAAISLTLALSLSLSRVKSGTGPVWGSGGVDYNPWKDQGLVPFGEYFQNLREYVSTQTGFLTVIQTDLTLPGRGLDLVVKRVYSPPSTYEDDAPATAADYSYGAYPWAPLGNGWQLGFPWIEVNGSSPAYIHLSDGQRYKYSGAGLAGTEYHSGDHFTLYGYLDGEYDLVMVDGTRYSFDDSYRLVNVTDTSGNQMRFTYSDDKISRITDTVGRYVDFTYDGGTGYLSRITSGSRNVTYTQVSGANGYKLTRVADSLNQYTNYTYMGDYLITKIEYPSGGYSTYTYDRYYSSGYERYRVSDQLTYDGSSPQRMRKAYNYTATFSSVSKTTIREGLEGGDIMKTSLLDYTSQSCTSTKLWNGTVASARIYETRELTDSTRRRVVVEKYPGGGASHVDTTTRHDRWGNVVYTMDMEGHETARAGSRAQAR